MGTVILEKIEEKKNSVDLVQRGQYAPLAERKARGKDFSFLENGFFRVMAKMIDFIMSLFLAPCISGWRSLSGLR